MNVSQDVNYLQPFSWAAALTVMLFSLPLSCQLNCVEQTGTVSSREKAEALFPVIVQIDPLPNIHQLRVHRLSVHRLPVHQLPVHRLPVHRLPVA